MIANNLRFSIIVPAYNEEQYLPRLLESIEVAALTIQADPKRLKSSSLTTLPVTAPPKSPPPKARES
jgi:hypothetical protein